MLEQTAPRPGIDVLAAFPSGAMSPELTPLGVLALTLGFLFRLPGRSRRRSRMVAGGRSGVIALCVYLAGVALLPHTRPTVVALRAVVRSLLELGQSGQVLRRCNATLLAARTAGRQDDASDHQFSAGSFRSKTLFQSARLGPEDSAVCPVRGSAHTET